jgi:hypothetical protein
MLLCFLSALLRDFIAFQLERKFPAQDKRYSTEDSETTINEAPTGRDTSDMPCDKGQRNDASAGDEAERNDPFIPDGIDVRTYECNGDD